MQATAALEGSGLPAPEMVPEQTFTQLSPNAMVAIALLVTVALVVIIAILLYFSFAVEQDVGPEETLEESEH